jgi:hypothetical protein
MTSSDLVIETHGLTKRYGAGKQGFEVVISASAELSLDPG